MSTALHPAERADLQVIHYSELASTFDKTQAPSQKTHADTQHRHNLRLQLRDSLNYVSQLEPRKRERNAGQAYARAATRTRELEKQFRASGGDPVAEGLALPSEDWV